jgi:hypothetical protein
MDDVKECPKCGRDLRDPNNEGYYLSAIVQYRGVRAQHMVDDTYSGGCNWAWSSDPEAARLVDNWNKKTSRSTDERARA